MTSFDAGDVVLVRYPFTDLSTTKRRPAVILSPRDYSDRFHDIVVIPLTSQSEPNASLALSQWKAAGLVRPTWVKPIIGTISTRLVEKRIGQLADVDAHCVRAALGILLDTRWTN